MSARVWLSVFVMRVKNMLQYRTAAWAGVATQYAWGFMYCMVYFAFYSANPEQSSMGLSQLIDYAWLRQAFLVIFSNYTRDHELADMITKGNVAYDLTRPVDLYFMWYARLLGQRVAGVALRCLPILLLALVLPEPFGLHLPASPAAGAMFLLTLFFALLLVVAMSTLLHALVFKTKSLTGPMLFAQTVMEFLSGNLLPIALMPGALQAVARCLPFMYVADMPLRIYSGHIPTSEAFFIVGMQLVWIFLFVLLGRLWVGRQIKHVVIQGG